MNTTTQAPDADISAIDAILVAYRPADLTAGDWEPVADDVVALVKRAGILTLTRVESDIQTIGRVASHLRKTGRPLTLDEILSDTALLDFDQALGRECKAHWSRAGHRSRHRRLQAYHRNSPWRGPRRAEGDRIADLPTPQVLDDLNMLLAKAASATTHGGEGLVLAVKYARQVRRGRIDQPADGPETPYWRSARAFARSHGVDLTRRMIFQAVTHEALQERSPLAAIAITCRLSREELGLGLTYAATLNVDPTAEDRALLRG